jgi:hypothetical protein
VSRFLIAALVALAISACRGGDHFTRRDLLTAPVAVNPTLPTLSGTWAGSASGSNFSLTMTHNTQSGTITGTGTVIDANKSLEVTVSGSYTKPNVSLAISTAGFETANFTGTHATNSITGTINGSGFSNAPITLSKR